MTIEDAMERELKSIAARDIASPITRTTSIGTGKLAPTNRRTTPIDDLEGAIEALQDLEQLIIGLHHKMVDSDPRDVDTSRVKSGQVMTPIDTQLRNQAKDISVMALRMRGMIEEINQAF